MFTGKHKSFFCAVRGKSKFALSHHSNPMKKTFPLVLLITALPTFALATDRFMTPGGDGAFDGTDWNNAYSYSQRAEVLNTTMAPGDTLYVGPGTYPGGLAITSSGASGNPKRIVGVDEGTGKPVFDSGTWSRTNPTGGPWGGIQLMGSSSYWEIENIAVRDCRYAVEAHAASPAHVGIVLRQIDTYNVRHGFYLRDCDHLTIELCTAKKYSKHGFRLDRGCNTVTFKSCTADMSDDDPTWWDYAENFPFGFIVDNGGAANTNISFDSCVAKNNLRNKQSDHDFAPTGNFPGPEDWDIDGDGKYEPRDIDNNPKGNYPGPEDLDANNNGEVDLGYWNGDGFVSENNTNGISFTRCVAINNENGGWDIKQAAGSTTTLRDCAAVANGKNYRFWYGTTSVINCVSAFPRVRGGGGQSRDGVEISNSTTTLNFFTHHGESGNGINEVGTGSATLTDSIVSFTGATGDFTAGSVTLGSGTVTYRPGAGTDPDYVNPDASWDGAGDDMNSQAFTQPRKGYYAGGDCISINLCDPSNVLAAGDVVGVVQASNWNNSTLSNEVMNDVKDNAGTATTADITLGGTPYQYVNSTGVLPSPMTDDAKMMRSQRGGSNSGIMSATAVQVPDAYATYDVYVYWGGRTASEPVPASMKVELRLDSGGGNYVTSQTKYMRDDNRLWDGTYNQSNATEASAAVDGNEYVVFSNLTARSFRIVSTSTRRTGFCGFQIVRRP